MKKLLILSVGMVLLAFWVEIPLSSAQQMYLEENRACKYLEQGKIDQAILLLNRKLKRYPQNYDCHLYLCLAYYLKCDFQNSLKTLSKVEFETERLEKAKSTIAAGKSMSNFGQEDAYLSGSSAVVFTKERTGVLKFALGMLYKKDKDYKNASKRFSEALKYKYPEIKTREQLLVVNCFLEEYKKAKEELDEILKSEEESDELSFMKGYVSYYLKEEAQAIESFSRISETMIWAKQNLAIVYYNQGNYNKALEIWQEILAENPDEVNSLKNSGRAYFHLGQEEKAQEQFDKIGLKIKPEKYSPKTIPLIFVDLFPEAGFDFQCKVES
jgi:tetratricopeptide (TPR) repeat protein